MQILFFQLKKHFLGWKIHMFLLQKSITTPLKKKSENKSKCETKFSEKHVSQIFGSTLCWTNNYYFLRRKNNLRICWYLNISRIFISSDTTAFCTIYFVGKTYRFYVRVEPVKHFFDPRRHFNYLFQKNV